MKKFLQTTLALCIVATLAIGLTGCGDKLKIVKDPAPYTFENQGRPVAEYDAGMTIDGKLDEARWTASEQRWLYGVDKPNANANQYAEIACTAFYGEKGIFFGLKVEEFGNRIWVNHSAGRDGGHINSAVDMYFGPVLPDAAVASGQTFEFSIVADGQYVSRVNQAGLVEVLTSYDKIPVVATQTIGGAVNTPECTGYVVEAFFPYAFLAFAGWDIPEDKSELTIGINPVHIFSFSLEGELDVVDRLWSNWAPNYGIAGDWLSPLTYFYFGENGLLSYDYTVKYGGTGKGTVKEVNGMPCILQQADATFEINAINGASITKLTVNGVNYLNDLNYNGAKATFTVNNPTEDIEIEVDFN